MLATTDTKKRRVFKTKSWFDIEPTVNLAKNQLKVNEAQLSEMLGQSSNAISRYRSQGRAPCWIELAIKGFLSDANGTNDQKPERAIVGMRFTNEQLEILNTALSDLMASPRANGYSEHAMRKLRATILLELASRLDGDS